jgi:hypothetical protein
MSNSMILLKKMLDPKWILVFYEPAFIGGGDMLIKKLTVYLIHENSE